MDGHALCLNKFTIMRLMDDVLRPFTKYFLVVYLDDILILNKTWEDHMHHIQ